jgi:DNA polymerase-3 subunit alpha
MYGSTHTHIESNKDTANMLSEALDAFHEAGCRKLAITEHGMMTSYEDLKDTLKKKSYKDEMELIPGVEIYFDYGEKRTHLILEAMDEEGYKSLCKIVTESNHNADVTKLDATTTITYPMTTLENLRKNVAKGHIICNSACIAGPFAQLLGYPVYRTREKLEKTKQTLEDAGYFTREAAIKKFEDMKAEAEAAAPTKEEREAAKALTDKEAKRAANKDIAARAATARSLKQDPAFLEAKTAAAEAADYIKKQKLTRTVNRYHELLEEEQKLTAELASGENQKKARELLAEFLDIFGPENFYFELQNHGIPMEKPIYNNIVKFAFSAKHPHFVASNDIHVAMKKDDPGYQDALLRRQVIQFTRMKHYEEQTPDYTEYGIKDDDELQDALLDMLEPIKARDGTVLVTPEEVAGQAIWNIREQLSRCHAFEQEKENHYPKFCDNDVELLGQLVEEGIKKKFPDGFPDERYEARVKKELDIISSMGYASYHLIVRDYLEYGRLLGYLKTDEEIAEAPLSIEELDKYITEKGYPRVGYRIGPGRGSAAGSLVCYLIGITDLDPIPYDLLFERFLNPERKSMPEQYWASTVNPDAQGCAAA